MAARRRLVAIKAASDAADTEKDKDIDLSPEKKCASDDVSPLKGGEVNAELNEEGNEVKDSKEKNNKNKDEALEGATFLSSVKKRVKTIEEINEEVAKSTAEFDKTLMTRDKMKKDNRDLVLAKKAAAAKPKVTTDQLMKVVRLLLIAILGGLIGTCKAI